MTYYNAHVINRCVQRCWWLGKFSELSFDTRDVRYDRFKIPSNHIAAITDNIHQLVLNTIYENDAPQLPGSPCFIFITNINMRWCAP